MPVLTADSTTLIIEDIIASVAFVDGDAVIITFVNPQTAQTYSGNGKTIQVRKDANVADLVFNVVKYSDQDTALNQLMNEAQTKPYEGSCKTLFYKDGNETFETYQISGGSFTTKPVDTKNNTDGNAMMTYTMRVDAKRLLTINGRSYVFGPMTHKNRLPIFAYLTKIRPMLMVNDMSFMGETEWAKMEQSICKSILFEKSQLSKLENHWDKYPGDYLMFCITALAVISHPFLAGNPTA